MDHVGCVEAVLDSDPEVAFDTMELGREISVVVEGHVRVVDGFGHGIDDVGAAGLVDLDDDVRCRAPQCSDGHAVLLIDDGEFDAIVVDRLGGLGRHRRTEFT